LDDLGLILPQNHQTNPRPVPPRQLSQLLPRLIAPLLLGALQTTGLAAAGELQALQQGTAIPGRPGDAVVDHG